MSKPNIKQRGPKVKDVETFFENRRMAQHDFRGMSKHAEVGSEAQDFVRLIRHPCP